MPAVMTHDELKIMFRKTVDESFAMDTAFVLSGCHRSSANGATVGRLADALRQSKVRYFWLINYIRITSLGL